VQAVIVKMLDLMMMMMNVTYDCDNGDCGDDDRGDDDRDDDDREDDDCGGGDCGDDGGLVRAAAAVVQAKREKPRGATQLHQSLTLSSPQSSSASVAQNFNELSFFFTMQVA